MPSQAIRLAAILLTLVLICACGRPPAGSASSSNAQNLPFDREPHSTGISPSQTLVPSGTKLPEGTPIPVRLQSALSSASTHAGDSFYASVDEPVEIDGQTVIARGTPVMGRVLEAKAASRENPNESSLEPGYLRIVLVSLKVKGKPVGIETSSIFGKGGAREERRPATGMAPSGLQNNDMNQDVIFGLDRRLNFRLAQAVDLQ
ncbi:MAG: hypothetical protein ABSG02_06185 [Terriglobales bacterium]|jgi:hypothetical protein